MSDINEKTISLAKLGIKQILEEKRKWELDKIEFESNPLHWSNNKRKMHGMNTLRGSLNKNRKKKFHVYRPSYKMFSFIEDMVCRKLQYIYQNDFFNNFVDVKDLGIGKDISEGNVYDR